MFFHILYNKLNICQIHTRYIKHINMFIHSYIFGMPNMYISITIFYMLCMQFMYIKLIYNIMLIMNIMFYIVYIHFFN